MSKRDHRSSHQTVKRITREQHAAHMRLKNSGRMLKRLLSLPRSDDRARKLRQFWDDVGADQARIRKGNPMLQQKKQMIELRLKALPIAADMVTWILERVDSEATADDLLNWTARRAEKKTDKKPDARLFTNYSD